MKEATMDTTLLISIMGVLTVIAVYFWWVRGKSDNPSERPTKQIT